MVTLRPNGPFIVFEPRQGFKRSHKTIELPLQWGHVCPYCSNVINAVFSSDHKIDLFPYEETTVLSQGEKNAGEILKIVPGNEPGHTGNYTIDFFPTDNGSWQRIRMKNHIVRLAAIQEKQGFSSEGIEEPGERPCFYTGFFSHREDLLIKDLLSMFGFSPEEFAKEYNVPTKVVQLIPDRNGTPDTGNHLKWIPAIGQAAPVLLLKREYLKSGHNYYLRQEMLQKYKKQPA